MKVTQTCVPQENESTKRWSTLAAAVGSPSVTILVLCKTEIWLIDSTIDSVFKKIGKSKLFQNKYNAQHISWQRHNLMLQL